MKPVSYISGASGYLGLKITQHLARQGKDLLLSSRDQNGLEELIQNISNRYPHQNFHGFNCDLAFPELWKTTIDVLNEFTVNEYINCSGIQGQIGPSSKLSYEDMNAVFNVNLFSSVFFTTHFANKIDSEEKTFCHSFFRRWINES